LTHFLPFESASVFDKAEFFERFLKWFLGVLGLIGLLFSIEFCSLTQNPLEKWVFDSFSPFDTESV